MRNLIILLGIFLFSFITTNIHAADSHPKPPIRDIINSIDHWIRKDWTLEKHIRHECEAHESWKIPRGHKRLRNFKIDTVTHVGDGYFVVATYDYDGVKCVATAKVNKQNDIWVNQEFRFNYHK
ncbi:hypothetical protein BRE01_68350 [Brevibacillus reuszeri]|uniref:Uncharacterized protein n=1 Tax=Brevibacillus reuszeri TaxID=54915 RepID=A0A0K9YLY1_9BACL|nr:hypothetical protein [Brevibacillus reuszeri]KNB69671.1 hypothetical protein ADS79_27870 [Brevibacillus reuszeri]MED1855946.1 hypothetical protein [Brevibacillus reuszeri]GED73133.1 hypothetical protein BRE01_68350 [Brevibacillus reuszeri]